MDVEIVCITTNGPRTDCQCISYVKTAAGIAYTVPQVIDRIQRGQNRFFVRDPTDGSTVIVKPVPEEKPRYIRTLANDTPNDNLLRLPDC